ncbi:MAG: hypothetical protein ACI909_003599 [Planctomycetota bacterium]
MLKPFLILITILGSTFPLIATAGTSPEQEALLRQIAHERTEIDQQRSQFFAQILQPQPESTEEFWRVYNFLEADRSEIADFYNNLIVELILSLSGQDENQESAAKLLDKFVTLEELRLAFLKKQIKQFRTHFSPRFVSRYIQAENKFKSFIDAGLANMIPLTPQN